MEVYRGDHDLRDYCTFGVEAANDAQTQKSIKTDTVVSQRT